MEEGTTNRSIHRYSKLIKGSWCSQFIYGSNPWLARYLYALMFLFATLLAWAVRDYGHKVLREFKRFKGCEGGKQCLGTEGVLRVSFGCFIFYFVMFLSTVGTSKLHERREIWHSGWWSAKIVLVTGLMVVPFFVPAVVITYYGYVAHFGAGVFLLVQLVSIISFITWLNDCCNSDKCDEKCRIHVMLAATAAYIICIVGIIFMYIWYVLPDPTACMINIFFITLTLLLLQLMTSVSRHPKVDIGFLTPGFMGLYVVFLCWSAIRSEPPGGKCLKNSETATNGDWLSIISFVVAVLAIVIATFSTGIDSKCFQFRKKEETESEDDVPYGFGFFHFVFATGAMYFAMLLVGWNTHHTLKKWTIDVGWASTWVRIVNEWLAACIYIWKVLAPIVWKSRKAAQTVG